MPSFTFYDFDVSLGLCPMNIDFPKAIPYYFNFWITGVAFLFKLLIKTINYITTGHVTQGAELYQADK